MRGFKILKLQQNVVCWVTAAEQWRLWW